MCKKIIVMTFALTLIFSGCSVLEPGLKEYDQSTALQSYRSVTREDEVSRLSREQHAAPSLDYGFADRYVDASAFPAYKETILNGIDKTVANASLTGGEAAMWKKIIESEQAKQVTAKDVHDLEDKLYASLEKIAAEQEMSLKEYATQPEYNMSLKEVKDMIKKQAKILMPEKK